MAKAWVVEARVQVVVGMATAVVGRVLVGVETAQAETVVEMALVLRAASVAEEVRAEGVG